MSTDASTHLPCVTEIAPLPGNPNVQRIKVDGRVAARLSASDVESLGIEVGQQWTAEVAARVDDALECAKARRTAMTLLGRRALSRGKLIERLMRRGHSHDVADRVTLALVQDHWLDDAAYAQALAEELARRKSASHRLIVERLIMRRIDESVAREAADLVLSKINPVDAATALAKKRLATMNNIEPKRAVRRIASLLARRGYDEETINETIDRLDRLAD